MRLKNHNDYLIVKGKYDPNITYAVGDVVSDTTITQVYTGAKWETMVTIDANCYNKPDTRRIVERCPHCGAVLRISKREKELGFVKCAFCDSVVNVFEKE